MSTQPDKVGFAVYTILFGFYFVCGAVTAVIMGISGYKPLDTDTPDTGDLATIIILWPLFVIKYLILGTIYLFGHGADLLFS